MSLGGLGFGRSDLPFAFEAAGPHGVDGLGVLHEGIPDEGSAEIFGHEKTDAEIDAEDFRVVPVEFGVEGVAEAVAAPGVFAEVVAECAEIANAIAGKERERSCGGAGHDGSVDWAHERRSAPGGVAVRPVGGADAPVVVCVAAVEAEAEGFVGASCDD